MSRTDPETLLELYLLGELDAEEAREVEAWLAERPERRSELDAARRSHLALEQGLAAPPDADALAERIVSRLTAVQARGRCASWWRAAAIAAALVAAALGIALLLHRRRPDSQQGAGHRPPSADRIAAGNGYPAPRAEGSYFLAIGNTLSRGSILRAGAGGATLELGGYCRLELAPDTVVRLYGTQRRERVFLEEGLLTCEVDPHLGEFAVETDFCTVSALGTRFIVQLRRKGDDEPAPQNEAWVQVLAGAALVSNARGQDILVAR